MDGNKSQNDVRLAMRRTASCRRCCQLLGGQPIVDLEGAESSRWVGRVAARALLGRNAGVCTAAH